MSRVHPQQHKQPTNTTTMVMEPLCSPAVWIWWYHAAQVVGGLVYSFFEASVDGFIQIQYINVEINIFVLTSMFNWCLLVRCQRWLPRRHPLSLADAQNIEIN